MVGVGVVAQVAAAGIDLVIVAIGFAWGTDAGYAINPARDYTAVARPTNPERI